MKYLLDTNICVYWLKGNEHIEQKVLSIGIDNIFTSFITVSELYYGAYKSQRVDQNLAIIRQLTERLNVIESDDAISETFGSLKTSLEKAGMIIDDADIYIAACARVYALSLVTNNTKHFRRIKGLKLDNWLSRVSLKPTPEKQSLNESPTNTKTQTRSSAATRELS